MPDFITINEINNNIDLQTNNILNAINNNINDYNNYGLFSTGINCDTIVFNNSVNATVSTPYDVNVVSYILPNRVPSGIYEYLIDNINNISNGDMIKISQANSRYNSNNNIAWTNYIFYSLNTDSITSILLPIYSNHYYQFAYVSNSDITTEKTISYDYYLKSNYQFKNNYFPYMSFNTNTTQNVEIIQAYNWTNFIITEPGWFNYVINCNATSTQYAQFKLNDKLLYRNNASAGKYINMSIGIYISESNINNGECKIQIYLPSSGTNEANIKIFAKATKFNIWGDN